MRIFTGFLRAGVCLIALTGCQDAMKENEIHPTADNLIEVDPSRLKIVEIKEGDNGILVVVGESTSRLCDIRVSEATLNQLVATNSIEERRIKAKCLWDGATYSLYPSPFSTAVLRIDESTVTIDLQLLDPKNKKYLAFTKIDKNIHK
ncbi:hypothetical protein [Microbulbifer sp. SSSA005]|uniref:hypothetical protein n=1 Tax=unclassified Microbulbifer TaxID=2619833 RepID=UPI00403AD850